MNNSYDSKVTNHAHRTWLEGKPLEGAIYWGRDLTDLHRQILPDDAHTHGSFPHPGQQCWQNTPSPKNACL